MICLRKKGGFYKTQETSRICYEFEKKNLLVSENYFDQISAYHRYKS